MLLIKKVRYKNFLSSGNHFIEIELDKVPKTIIIGKNGRGKSTFWNAICFGLFGDADRGVNKGSIINSINKKNCLVELDLESMGRTYLIRRGLKPNIFEIFCDGILIDQNSKKKDYQKQLEEDILRLNLQTFKQICVISKGNYVPFMKLKTPQRRTIVESILDLEVFSEMNKTLKQLISDNKTALEDNTSDMKSNKNAFQILKDQYQELKNAISSQSEDWMDKIEKNNLKIEDLRKSRQEYLEKLSNEEKVKDLKASLSSSISELTDSIFKLDTEKSNHCKTHNFFSKHSHCPTCKQEIEESFKAQVILDVSDQIESIDQQIKQNDEKLSNLKQKFESVETIIDKFDSIHTIIGNIDLQITTLETSNKELQQSINDIRKSNDEQIEKVKAKLKEYASTLHKLTNDREDLLKQKERLSVCQDLLKDDAIKASIIKEYIPIINSNLNRILATLNFYVSFNLDENFDEVIKSRHRDDFSYDNFSEGEKQRIDLALMFTWREIAKIRNSMNCNLLIMDETLDGSLDEEGKENLMTNLLESLQGTNVFVITHGMEPNELFNRVIKFDKKSNFTVIKEEMIDD